MKQRLFALLMASLVVCTCSTLAIAYEPQVCAAATSESSGVTVKYFPSETTGVAVKNFPNEATGVSTRVINANDTGGITVSPVMSYAEMLDYMVNVKHFSYEEAIRLLSKAAISGEYRILSVELSVENKPNYKPKLDFYCQVSVGDGVWGIQDILFVQMGGSNEKGAKLFFGDINTWLRGSERIEYVVNGEFYDCGDTSSMTGIGDWYGYCYNSAIKRII